MPAKKQISVREAGYTPHRGTRVIKAIRGGHTDLYLLVLSRGARSFAGGILSVIIGLYYRYHLHLSLTMIGILFAIGALFTPLLTLVIGRYADIHGRKRLLLLTLFFLPVAVLILLLTDNIFLLAVSAAIGGFGIAGGIVGGGVGASVAPMQTALLAEKTNTGNRTMLFSAFTIISSIAGSAGAVLANLNNYEVLFAVALFFALVVMMKRTNPSRAVRKGVKTMAEAVRTPPTAKRSPIVPFDIRNWCLSMIGRNGMIRP